MPSLLAGGSILLGATAVLAGSPSSVAAQAEPATPAAVVRVTVRDSAGAPIAGAELRVNGNVAGQPAITTDSGTATLVVRRDAAEFEIIARRIGYRTRGVFVRAAPRDTVDVAIMLARAVQRLDDVRITARNLRRESYYIDAESIAASERHVGSALDVVLALRQNMLTSRAGWRVCGTLQDVWINGVRMPKNLVPDPVLVTRQLPGVPPQAPRVPPEVLTILSQVRPEHIEQMEYLDCFDSSLARAGAQNAVFIVLKPGVRYRFGYGTVVVGPDDGDPPR